MAKPHPLQAAVQVAQSKEQDAVKAMGESQQHLSDHKYRLEQLLVFRGEYVTRFHEEGSGGISARRYQDYSAFLNHMDNGIAQVQTQMAWLQRDVERKRALWLQSRAKTKALQEVIERDRQAKRQEEERREQRNSDEHSLRKAAARPRFTDGA